MKPTNQTTKLTLIVAVSENNVIGKDNELVWRLKNDLKRFKELTSGHCIIMGRKTFESFPNPLPNRTHIVITRQPNYKVPEGVIVVNSLEDAIEASKQDLGLSMQLCILGASPCESVSIPWEDVHDTGPLDQPRPGLSQSGVTSSHLHLGPLCRCEAKLNFGQQRCLLRITKRISNNRHGLPFGGVKQFWSRVRAAFSTVAPPVF